MGWIAGIDGGGSKTAFCIMNTESRKMMRAVFPSICPKDVGRILRTFKIKKNVEVTDNGKIII